MQSCWLPSCWPASLEEKLRKSVWLPEKKQACLPYLLWSALGMFLVNLRQFTSDFDRCKKNWSTQRRQSK